MKLDVLETKEERRSPRAVPEQQIYRFGRKVRRAPEKVVSLPLEELTPNPHRPRRFYDPDSILSLADSIRRCGILQPLTVRPIGPHRYALITGERRLRAAHLLEMREVPCIIEETDEAEAAALSLLDHLHREQLDMFEQAAALSALLSTCSLTQEEAAARLSVSQSFVANKLRLLRFLPDERELILQGSLTERHARTLLRLQGDDRLRAIRRVIAHRMNVAETEAYVDRLTGTSVSTR